MSEFSRTTIEFCPRKFIIAATNFGPSPALTARVVYPRVSSGGRARYYIIIRTTEPRVRDWGGPAYYLLASSSSACRDLTTACPVVCVYHSRARRCRRHRPNKMRTKLKRPEFSFVDTCPHPYIHHVRIFTLGAGKFVVRRGLPNVSAATKLYS